MTHTTLTVGGARGATVHGASCTVLGAPRPNSNRKELVMRLSPARVEQTLSQFEAQVLPDNHPSMPKIREMWGDHT